MNNPKENIMQLALTVVGMISAYWASVLASKNSIELLMTMIILISMAIIVWLFTNEINKQIIKIAEKKITEQFNFEKKIEGLWIERYSMDENGKFGYCLIEIIYNELSRILHLKGNVYDSNGKAFANWNSKSVYTDKNQKSILYIYDGEFMDSRLVGNGYGKLDFNNSNSDTILTGTGCFEDANSKFIPKNFDIDRIDNGLCKELIDECMPKHSFDKERLILKYHKYLENNKSGC
ncbi:MAG: hypothetical protein GQ564_01135 [Bacteroidales bacterium]|nr:hypothetical protein [Bacteroidales bacterium]